MATAVMSTKRTPKNRPLRPSGFTPAALDAFRRHEKLLDECTCTERDWRPGEYGKWRPCAACQERGRIQIFLHNELRLQPWEISIQHPDAVSPYPKGSVADQQWRPKPDAQARYLALEAAVEAEDAKT